MKETFAVINEMVADGAIENYAVAGAIGAMFYVEPFSTEDLDVFVLTPEDRFVIELPGSEYLKARGYTEIRKGRHRRRLASSIHARQERAGEGSVPKRQQLDFEGVMVRVALPEHLVAIALNVGRTKDLARVEMFLEQKEVDIDALEDVVRRHGLYDRWIHFKTSYDSQQQ